ncbi:MAG: SPFH/Band 7/PHB domain protein [Lachnospiraceae bacterium]|nr:SPFH/Band 7/PHB domain protein [Lachnospiraceae bacterium]
MQALFSTGFVVLILLLILIFKSICIVPQASAYIVETLGKYKTTLGAGLNFMWPFIDRVIKKVSLKEQVADFEPQPVITKDNVTMMVDSVVFFQVFDARLFTYGVERPIAAIENLSATTLRNIIGSMTLDETLTSRDSINAQITSILDEATDKWGIKVNRVEVKNIQPPRSIQDAMEKQMRAEREKREAILTAEGKKQSAITLAEGEKQAAILRAEAVKEQRIREAEGEAEALLAVQRARAEGIKLINESRPSTQYLQLKSFETAEKMADGQATKIIVPSEIANLTGTLSALSAAVRTDQPHPGATQGHPAAPQGIRREVVKPAAPKAGIIDKIMGDD